MDVIEYIKDFDGYLKILDAFLNKQKDYECELLRNSQLSSNERTTLLSNSFPEYRSQLENIRRKQTIIIHPVTYSKKIILEGTGKVSDVVNEKRILLDCGNVMFNDITKGIVLDIMLPEGNSIKNYKTGDARKFRIGDAFNYKVELNPLMGNTDYEGEFRNFTKLTENLESKLLFYCRSIDFEETGVNPNLILIGIAFILMLLCFIIAYLK